MPLHFTSENPFDVPAHIRVNTVNCVGVMGRGIALEFKRRYPFMFPDYRFACARGEVVPGKLHIYEADDCVVVNLPTKKHWVRPSRYEWVESGLVALRQYLDTVPVNHVVALPALGCSNGGLAWTRVKPMIEEHLGGLPHHINVFEPGTCR